MSPQAFSFAAKELVFDIDLDTYDGLRTCCSGPTLCRLCWRFVCVAVKVIDRALHGKLLVGFQAGNAQCAQCMYLQVSCRSNKSAYMDA